MMQRLVYILILAILLVEFLMKAIQPLARMGSLIPDLLSVVASLMIIGWFGYSKLINIHPKYILLLVVFLVHFTAGTIINEVSPGAIVAGMRNYLKFIPFFLLPAVYCFSDDEMRRQLWLIMMLALLQFPIVLFQRFVSQAGVATGDYITGTLNISSELSLFLIACIALWFSFYLKKRITKPIFLLGIAALFLPTTLNETKGTLILLPIALAIPAVLVAKMEGRLSSLLPMGLIGILLVSVFVGLYSFSKGGKDASVVDYFAKGRFVEELYRGAEGKSEFDSEEVVGRVDSYVLAASTLSETPLYLLMGLGAGNVAQAFHPLLAGKYTDELEHMQPKRTALAILLWELGLIGMMLILLGCWLVYLDCRQVRKRDDFSGVFAVGWSAIVVLYVVSLTYKNVLIWNVVGYFFFYFSGYVAASRVAETPLINSPKLQ